MYHVEPFMSRKKILRLVLHKVEVVLIPNKSDTTHGLK